MRWSWLVAGTLALAPAAVAAQDGGIAVGTVMKPLAVKDLDGNPVDLSAIIGKKPAVIEFWATWCTNCEDLLPSVRAAQKKYGDRVEFLGINVTVNQTPEKVRRYLDKHQPPFRTLYDTDGVSVRAFKAPTTAYVVVLDRTGKVVYTGLGADQDIVAAVARAVGA